MVGLLLVEPLINAVCFPLAPNGIVACKDSPLKAVVCPGSSLHLRVSKTISILQLSTKEGASE